MIRRSPAEVYIQYLLVHPKGYSNAAIREILTFAQLDYLGDWYLNRLRERLQPPKPFYPFDPDHYPSRHFILVKGLGPIFSPDDAGRKAFKILELPRVKEFVEAMLISNAPAAAIAHTVTKRHQFPCTATVIDRYRSFFWDVSLLDSSELRALLQLRYAQIEKSTDPEIKAQYDLMKRAYYADARKTAADLPFSPMSALLAQMRMGVMPSELDVATVVLQARKFAAIRTCEAAMNNGKGDSANALNFAIVMEKATNVLKEMINPDDELRDQLTSIALRTSTDGVPTVHTLSAGGGSFTTDTGPKENRHELPVDDDAGDGSPFDVGEPG